MIEVEAIKHIQKAIKPEVVNIEGDDREFVLYPDRLEPIYEPVPVKLTVYTLADFAEFVKNNDGCVAYIRVNDFDDVEAVSVPDGDHAQEHILANAAVPVNCDCMGERFNINARALEAIQWVHDNFRPTDNAKNLVNYLAGIRSESAENIEFDGITHTVTAKTGTVSMGEIRLTNPVELEPLHATFQEIDQPKVPINFTLEGRTAHFKAIPSRLWVIGIMKAIKAKLVELIGDDEKAPPIYV